MTADEARAVAERVGLTVVSAREAVPEAYPGIEWVVQAHGRISDGVISELDTLQRMTCLGPVERTPRPGAPGSRLVDGYTYSVDAGAVRVVSTRMWIAPGECGYRE